MPPPGYKVKDQVGLKEVGLKEVDLDEVLVAEELILESLHEEVQKLGKTELVVVRIEKKLI